MTKPQRWTEEDFDRLSWHDNYLYGLQFSIGDYLRGDWRAELVLDFDHIVEWVCGTDQRCRFLVAPATLTFHHVTDLKLGLDWGDSGFRTALHEISIAQIERERIQNQQICFDRPYYRWEIQTHPTPSGTIAFGASGFTQQLRAEPLLTDEQKLSPSQRHGLGPAHSV